MKRTFTAGLAGLLGLALTAGVWGQTSDFLGKSAADWARELEDKKASTNARRSAAFALGRIGAGAERYLPLLLRYIRTDEQLAVRETAAAAMADIIAGLKDQARGSWPTVGQQLLEQLRRENAAGVRRGLCSALGGFGPAAAPAVPDLLAALSDKDPSVRQNAAFALGRIGSAAGKEVVPDLCRLLRDDNVLVRRDAATALGDIGLPTAQEAVEPMMDLVIRENDRATGDPVVLKTAVEKLIKLAGDTHRTPARRLYPLLDNDDPETARAAAFVLSNVFGLTPEEKRAAGEAELLGQLGQPGQWKQPLADKDAGPILKVLREALKDDEAQVQEQAAASLGQLGPVAFPAVEDLASALTTAKAAAVRRNAALALGSIGPRSEPAVPELVKALKRDTEPEAEVRLFAAEALFRIGYPANEKALPTVVDVIRSDPSGSLRHRCLGALFNVDNLGKYKADEVLLKVLDETSRESLILRYDSARVLAQAMKETSPDKVAATLLEMLLNKNLQQYEGANARVEGAGSETTRGQTEIKEKSGGDGRFMAAQALGWVGKKANTPAIVKALEDAAAEKDKLLRETAAAALKSIRPEP